MLATLDWVMASVHASFDKDPTGRVLHAMQSLHVDCIGHLTSRRIGVRNPSAIEVEKVVEGALETGTFLEINSSPTGSTCATRTRGSRARRASSS